MNSDFRTDQPVTVSVILPCRNENRQIETSLGHILNQETVPGGFEVIVADGMSDDGTRAKLEALSRGDSRIRVLDNPGRIVSTGLNAAIRHARGRIIVRMDAHTDYDKDYIRRCVEQLEESGADCVGGPWLANGRGFVSRAIATAFSCPWVVGGARSHDSRYEGQVDTVYLGCWRREAFEKFGFFDEELVRNQDDELSLRICRGGGRIWQSPRIRSVYHPRNTLQSLFRQYMQYGYWKVRVIQKHRLPASWRHLIPGVFLLSILGLGCLGFFTKLAFWGWATAVGAYAVLNLTASLCSARGGKWSLLPVLPAVVGCFHFGYGYGFLRGLFDFVVRRKSASSTFTSLTRSSSDGVNA